MRCIVFLFLALTAATPLAGQAPRQWVFPFGEPNVRPSSHPDVMFYSSARVSEGSTYTVTGGSLQQRTSTLGSRSAGYGAGTVNGITPTAARVNANRNIDMEFRARVLTISGTTGMFAAVHDGIYRYQIDFSSTGFALRTPGGGRMPFAVNVFNWHTYRIESDAASPVVRVYVDNVLAVSGTAQVASGNGFVWGDGSSGGGGNADVDWDWVRVVEDPLRAPARLTLTTPSRIGQPLGLLLQSPAAGVHCYVFADQELGAVSLAPYGQSQIAFSSSLVTLASPYPSIFGPALTTNNRTDATGEWSLELLVPNDPRLVGLTFYCEGFVPTLTLPVPPNGYFWQTNLLTVTIQ